VARKRRRQKKIKPNHHRQIDLELERSSSPRRRSPLLQVLLSLKTSPM